MQPPNSLGASVRDTFDCQRCGHCCEGHGGIVLQPADQIRLAQRLGLSESAFCDAYAELSNGKLTLRVGDDDRCVFFREGCTVHEVKPAVCRAWPYYRGNLLDPVSWEMAADYCPGIVLAAGHEAFIREGLAWLKAAGLLAPDAPQSPNALILTDD